MKMTKNVVRFTLVALSLLLVQISQATVFFIFNGTDDAIQTWVTCNFIHDSKNKPYTIYPQFRLSIPFIQKPFCNIGVKGAEHGFFWKDVQGKVWKGDEATGAAMLGNDIFIITGAGTYTRVTLPSGMPIIDVGRFLAEKLVDLIDAIKTKKPLDAFFKTIGIPGVNVSLRQGQPEDLKNLY